MPIVAVWSTHVAIVRDYYVLTFDAATQFLVGVEILCVCVCVCARECVCVCKRERVRACVCVCV